MIRSVNIRTHTPGEAIDVYRPATRNPLPVVLLWHGRGPRERNVLAPLAERVARGGVVVVVPDWRSNRSDHGRADLMASLDFVRTRASDLGGISDQITLGGWSAGARAAAGIATNPALVDGWRPWAVVGIAASYDTSSPTARTTPTEDLVRNRAEPVPTWLVHGTLDAVVDVQASRRFAKALDAAGWPVHLVELPVDHAGAVLTEYSAELDRCIPLNDSRVPGRETVRAIVDAACS